MFSDCIKSLNLEGFEFRPYSLRRGGATCWFGRYGSLDRILVLGRWAGARTARIYINDGLAMLAQLKLPHKSLLPFVRVFHQHDLSTLPSKLEHTKAGKGDVERGERKRRKMEKWRVPPNVLMRCGEVRSFALCHERESK